MTRNLRTARAASDELAAAVRWYDAYQPGLGSDFFETVVEAIRRIQDHPLAGTPLTPHDRTRRILLARFPYQVVYHVRDDEIVIVAVAHLRRRPGYWKDRE